MARQYQVDPERLQDGHDMRPHLDQLWLAVAVVGALGIRRMMEVSDDPLCFRSFQVQAQPPGHQTRRLPIQVMGVEANKVRPAVIERVKRLGAGGYPPGLSPAGTDVRV